MVLAAGLLALLLVRVVVLPGQAAESARRFPEAAYLQVPVLALAIVTVACVQVAVVCVMALVGQGRIFDPGAHRWVDVFIAATALASVLVLGTGSYVSATVGSPAVVSGALVDLDVMMARRKMRLGELAQRTGITVNNLSALDRQPGDLLRWEPEPVVDVEEPVAPRRGQQAAR